MAAGADDPLLSVVVCTERFETLRPLVTRLEAQDVARQVELVVVCPSVGELGLAPSSNGALARVKAIEHTDGDGSFTDLGAARAAGVRAASAPLVALGETHSFPAPGWAEALIEAHREQGPAAAAPVVLNANPRTTISWANLITDYGPWTQPSETGPRNELPGHNSCYQRRDLLVYGARLGWMLAYEAALHADLRRRGRELLLTDAAHVRHLNVSLPRYWLSERFAAGRAYAATRSADWPPWRGLAYVLGGPLIPIVRLRRLIRIARRTRGRPPMVRLLPVLAAGLVVHALGEVAGFALGPGRSWKTVSRIEIYREDTVRPDERPRAT